MEVGRLTLSGWTLNELGFWDGYNGENKINIHTFVS